MGIFPKVRGENKKCSKPPPSHEKHVFCNPSFMLETNCFPGSSPSRPAEALDLWPVAPGDGFPKRRDRYESRGIFGGLCVWDVFFPKSQKKTNMEKKWRRREKAKHTVFRKCFQKKVCIFVIANVNFSNSTFPFFGELV